MRLRTCIIALAASAALTGCAADTDVCEEAAAHLEACFDSPATVTNQCDPARAEEVLSQSCEDLRAGGAKGDLFDFLCESFGIFCPAWDPCGGLTCGDSCTVCDPNDPDCFETAVPKFCDVDGACVASVPECPEPFDPCAGLSCGDSCNLCDPDDPNCFETDVPKFCDASGACAASVPECGFDPCAGLSCGDSCNLCPPNDPDCFETAVPKFCNAEGTCEASVPECSASCCDVLEVPGSFGNPSCFEGASCCADGTWACNDGAGNSTCDVAGETCEITECAGFLGTLCPSGDFDCVDYPLDACDPANGGNDCLGMCVPS